MENVTVNYWVLFYLIAASQGVFVSLLLLRTRKGKRNANLFLSGLVFLLSVYLFDLFLGRSKLLYQFPDLVFFASPIWYLFAPLTYFYVKATFDSNLKLNWKMFLHSIPFLYSLAMQIPFYLLPAEVKINIWENGIQPPYQWYINFFHAILPPVQILVYTVAALKIIIKEMKAGEDRIKLNEAHHNWLKFTYLLLIAYAIFRIVFITRYFITYDFIQWVANVRFLFFSSIIYSISYFAIIEPERIFPPSIFRRKLKLHIPTKEYAKKLVEIVENEKLYLNSNLKYTDLAQRLNISARYLTDIFRKEFGCSFNDFINKYRVEEVKRRMLIPENAHYSLLAIALDSGFSNKSSFNRIFKSQTGKTPTQFLKENKEETEVRKSNLA